LRGNAVGGGRGRFSGEWMIDTDLHGSPRVFNQKTPYAQSENQSLSEATKESETVSLLKISEYSVVRQEAIQDSDRVWAQIGLPSRLA